MSAKTPEEQFTDSIVQALRKNPITPMALESKDGAIVGGLIIVRGEHEFGVLKAFLQARCGNAAQAQFSELKPTA